MSKNEKAEQPAPLVNFGGWLRCVILLSIRSFFFTYIFKPRSYHVRVPGLTCNLHVGEYVTVSGVCTPLIALMSPLTVGNLFRAQISAWNRGRVISDEDAWAPRSRRNIISPTYIHGPVYKPSELPRCLSVL